MPHLSEQENQALQLFKQKLLQAFPDKVDSVKLFGSKARGDAAKHSDIDVLVIFKTMAREDKHSVSHIAAEVLLEAGVVLSTKTFSQQQIEDMKNRRSVFWQTIEPDLIAL